MGLRLDAKPALHIVILGRDVVSRRRISILYKEILRYVQNNRIYQMAERRHMKAEKALRNSEQLKIGDGFGCWTCPEHYVSSFSLRSSAFGSRFSVASSA